MPRRSPLVTSAHPFNRLAAVVLWGLVLALSLSRIDPTDTPWHLATAKQAFITGVWPTLNTFSYTFPDYPLYQQYPLYQSCLYLVWNAFGFAGLSVLCSLGFLLIFCLMQRWAKTSASCYALLWFLAILGLQQRMVLRPTLFSMLLLVTLLLAIERYRLSTTERKRWFSALAIVLVQYLWILSHQVFIIGLLMQLGYICSVLLRPWTSSRWFQVEERQPITPLLFALLASSALIALSPLGVDAYHGIVKTFQGLDYLRGHVQELRPLYEQPYAVGLVALTLIAVFISWFCANVRYYLFELGVISLLLCMAVIAWRGVGLFVPLAIALVIKGLVRRDAREQDATMLEGILAKMWAKLPKMLGRYVQTAVLAGMLCLVLVVRWVPPLLPILGQQAGVGKSIGQWPDAMMAYLRDKRPPGHGINLSWYLGNALIWELYPQVLVFVDPRTETYPKKFIKRVFAAERSDVALAELLREYQPQWLLIELRNKYMWQRIIPLLRSNHWRLMYVDPVSVLLVRKSAQTEGYFKGHAQNVEEIRDSVHYSSVPRMRSQQESRVREFFRFLERERLLHNERNMAHVTAQ